MIKKSVLLIDDNPQLAYALRRPLQTEFQVIEYVSNLNFAEKKLQHIFFDLVILDRMLPDGDGLELLPFIYEVSAHTKVLVLSEKGQPHSKVLGLQKGADDYLSKPFFQDELLARVRALMRRSILIHQKKLHVKAMTLYIEEQRVVCNKIEVHMSPNEFRFFHFLAVSPNYFCSKQFMETNIWTLERYPSTSSLDVLVRRVRKKIEPLSVHVVTRYNKGYELVF